MSRWPLLLPLALALAAPADAWALKPAKHRELAETACKGAGLPTAFCRRMGKQAYETDYLEWDTLAAHAQREHGQDRCTAAEAAITRVDRLAREMVDAARRLDHEAAAIKLGAALHTIQDECAHHGMTNQEHAYYSLITQCGPEDVSPDTRPAALACAQVRTQQVIAVAAAALRDTDWSYVDLVCSNPGSDSNQDACANASLPSPFMACDFLAEHKDWDGNDSTWEPNAVGDALVASFTAGARGELAVGSVCDGNPRAIDPASPRAHVDNQAKSCASTDLLCLGKVDEAGAPADEIVSAGCNTSGGAGLGLLFILLIPALRRYLR